MNTKGIVPIWGFTILVSIFITILLAWWAEQGIKSLNSILNPCQHGGSFINEVCDCSNSNGLFGGKFCDEPQCKNGGVLVRYSQALREDVISVYGCRCPDKWSGFLCDKCYAKEECTGECNDNVKEGPYGNCNKVCLAQGNVADCSALDLDYTGVCNACNGHGTCNQFAECECQNGWFDSEDGVQCSVSCDEKCGKHADCKIVDGTAKCFCKEGFWNEPECDVACPGLNHETREGTVCNGHGSCYYDGSSQNISNQKYAYCACDKEYVAENSPACAYECPRRETVDEPCSGHGECYIDGTAKCRCSPGWYGDRCDCNPEYTCFGHGECHPNTGECICYNGGTTMDQDIHVNATIHSTLEGAIDTFQFNAKAHYVSFQSDTFHFFDGMVINITKNSKSMPITIKTAVQNGTQHYGELQEISSLATFYGLNGMGPFDGFSLIFEFNWDPSLKPDLGFYKGPRCLECQTNWYPAPKMGDTGESCNVYCNPNAEYKWFESEKPYPFSGSVGFGCWGRGQCEINEEPTCKCNIGTDPDTNCAECMPTKYPKYQWTSNPIKEHCSEDCVQSTCNGHGRCNEMAYKDESEDLCVCDLNAYGMDTLNSSSRCTTCENNWYPNDLSSENACSDFCSDSIEGALGSGCNGLIKEYTDTYDDLVITTKNLHDREIDITTRVEAPEKKRVINCLNCQTGTCSSKGQCECPDGVTGVECQNACIVYNDKICAGHGTCSQNQLHLLFEPDSKLTQCECNPQDQYTEATREYYQRIGVPLDPKPSKEYYGQACEYHCPTYNKDVCANRGECRPVPVGSKRCKNNEQCEGSQFCAVTSSPWDEKGKALGAASYFVTPSPGAVQCSDLTCQEDVENKDWSQFCVAMLKGLYPEELNTPTCAHNKEKDSECAGKRGHIKCSTALEDAFSKAKTCSMFNVENETIRVYDAWDVHQMGITTVVINVRDDSTIERKMTPIVYKLEAVNKTHYKSDGLDARVDINNTVVLYNIGCGDTYGLNYSNPLGGDGTGHLTYASDTCETTDCSVLQYTNNPWDMGESVSNSDGCCKCGGTDALIRQAFQDNTVHNIQLYHDKNWCDMSQHIFEESGAITDVCSSVPDTDCFKYTDRVECSLDERCLYDVGINYQREVKEKCLNLGADECDAQDTCIYNSNTGTCDARTFCRARNCQDTINDLGISPFCIDIPIPEWCPATPEKVQVEYQEMKAYKNVEKIALNVNSIDECATQVALLDKTMFEYDQGCFYYNKLYDLQREERIAYRLSGYKKDAIEAYKTQWEDQCFTFTSQITQITPTPENIFYQCWNLKEKNYPFVIGTAPRGGIKLFHEEKFNAFVRSVSNMKQAEDYNGIDKNIEVNAQWCKNHIASRYPTGSLLSYAEATQTSRQFEEPDYATICSSGQSDLLTGYSLDTSSAAKHTLFWERVFKRQYGKDWACSTRNKQDVGSWDPGARYILHCKNGIYNIDEPNERFEILSKLQPEEIESCIIIPNMDALVWKPSAFNVLSRTQSKCKNIESTSRHVLNNKIDFDTKKDISMSIPEKQKAIFEEYNDPLDYPELLYRSRTQYLHRPGTCLDGKLFDADNESQAYTMCSEMNDCDGYSVSQDGWFLWQFGTYEEIPTHQSYIKATSLMDDCHAYVGQRLFEPKQAKSSKYSVPQVSSAFIVSDKVLELTKKQAGAIQMDGWTYPLELEKSSRFYVTGSNLPNNFLLVEYVKVQVDFTNLQEYNTRKEAETTCFTDPNCNGILYPSNTFDKFGFGNGKIYTTSVQAVPSEDGNAYYAPNLFKFVIQDNEITSTEMLDRPYDVEIVWPAADYYGERDIQMWGKYGWSPSAKSAPWKIGNTILTPEGIVVISGSIELPITDVPAERFMNQTDAEDYAQEKYQLTGSHQNSDGTYSPGTYAQWRHAIGNDKISVFTVENEGSNLFIRNAPYGKVHVTKQHIERTDISVPLSPINLCFVNVRGDCTVINETNVCDLTWDHMTTQPIDICQFKSKYYSNGTMKIQPDYFEDKIGQLTPNSDLKSGTWIESNFIVETTHQGPRATIASTTTVKNVPSLTFDTQGSIGLAFTRNGKETFDLTIVDNVAYINKNFNITIPKSNTGWTITYKDDKMSVNDNAGVAFRGGIVPDTIHIWNILSNTSSRVMDLKHNGNDMLDTVETSWSTKKSMYPGELYTVVQTRTETYKEDIDIPMKVQWKTGSWVEDSNTMTKQVMVSSKEECIEYAMNYYWEGKGPVQYLHYLSNQCTIYWDDVLTHSDSADGETLVLPRPQYHVSGFLYMQESSTSVRKLRLLDLTGYPLVELQMRSGVLGQIPTTDTIDQNKWHYWSVDINRVVPKKRQVSLQIGNENDTFVQNTDEYLATYSSNRLSIEPILITKSFVIDGKTWVNKGVDMQQNSSVFECLENLDDFKLGRLNITLDIVSHMYSIQYKVGEITKSKIVESVDASLHGGSLEMSNQGFDNSDFRVMRVRVRNRRSNSLCNIKEQLFDMVDEIAIQECAYSEECYKSFQVNSFEICKQNEKYNLPDNTPEIANQVDWVAYCDYAFPETDESEQVCEGLWVSSRINGEINILEKITPVRQILNVVYSRCSIHQCENVSKTVACDNVCKRADLKYLDDKEEEKLLLMYNGNETVTVNLLDWHTIKCNSVNDHIGIHNGDWVPECNRIDDMFPVFQCKEGKASEEGELLGFGKTVEDCKGLLNDKTPLFIQMGNSQCFAFYTPVDIVPASDYHTCSLRYGGIPDPTKSTSQYTVPGCTTYPFDEDFYSTCFAKTTQFTATCPTQCINHLRKEIDDTDCKKVENLRDIHRLTGNECASEGCQKELDNMIPKQFCSYQTRYHDIQPDGIDVYHGLIIPDLESTSCSGQCIRHLERSLDYKDWENWCLSYASGELEGFCSVTDCSCDDGYDGRQCELKCPMGSSDGKDETCSGTNGFCIAKDSTDISNDVVSQNDAGEIEGPPWKKGPSTVPGMCECIAGSGEACELQCANNNNGTYGPLHLNQFGICDTFLAIVKPLPPCTRYNSMALTSEGEPVAPNSTTYDMSRIIHPERLVRCTDQDMIDGATLDMVSDVKQTKHVLPSSNANRKDATRVFQYCFPYAHFKIADNMTKYYNPQYIPEKWYVETSHSVNIGLLWNDALASSASRSVNTVGATNGTGLYLSSNISLWVDNGYVIEHSGTSSHVLLYGEVPYKRRYPGLVALNSNTVLMFGGRVYFSDEEYEDTDELYVLRLEHFKFSNQQYSTVSFSKPSVSGSPGARAMPVMVQNNDIVYMFGGNMVAYNKGEPYLKASPATVWELKDYVWSALRPIEYGQYNPMQTYQAWMSNHIYLNGLICTDTCTESNHACEYCAVAKTLETQETGCKLTVDGQRLFLDSEIIASWDIPLNTVRIWYHDWKMIDPDFGGDFEQRYNNIFHAIVEENGIPLDSVLPRAAKIVVDEQVPNGTGVVMTLDECRAKSKERFDYIDGKCIIGSGKYLKIKNNGINKEIVKEVNRIFKRAVMMQGRYSVLNEMGINSITDEWQGFDWMIRREVGPITTLPITDGSKNIHMSCVSNNCKRSSAVAFQKAKYERKELEALCQSMTSCVPPCETDGNSCKGIEAYTVPEIYYMLDFSAPITAQSDTYHMIQGREAYTINVLWSFSNKNFDDPLNEGTVFKMEGKTITINITNTRETGGIRLLWSNEGWLYKSREPFNNYYVDQTHANRNLHRGGTCGTSAGQTCPGAKTYYNVPCSGRGTCELSCECVCDRAPEEYYLESQRIAGSAPDDPDGSAEDGISSLTNNPAKSPFRGPDCSVTCPGYDGWSVTNICSGHGSCGDRGQCICDYGYIGDNCQFKCPGFDNGKICGKKGSCTLADMSADSFRVSDRRNRFRFLSALKTFYSTCNSNFMASKYLWASNCKDNDVCGVGMKKFVGETCSNHTECHSGICGGYHGCDNICVRPDPEQFPSPKGILIDKEVKHGISPEWKDYNCPVEDTWYDTMWVLLEGEIGTVHFDGTEYEFRLATGANKIEKSTHEKARSWCDTDNLCFGVSNTTYWSSNTMPLYFRQVSGGTKIWIKNPFTTTMEVFESREGNKGTIGHKLSKVMPGKIDGVCSIPSQQTEETPWVKRPIVESFVQKYDEPLEDFVIGGYGGIMDWGFNATTGLTTIRDLKAPTVTSVRRCEILPGFELRCPTCDCFSDSIQGFWDGPMCSMCKRGYATKTCKKVCPGYDGKNDNTICSGNGVCNFGIEGTGRCMCGGKDSNALTYFYKDQDSTPPISSADWCNQFDITMCEIQPYCVIRENECTSLYLQRTSKPSVPPTYPQVHEYSYYHVRYREYTSFVWPTQTYLYNTVDEKETVDTTGIARQQGLGQFPGVWYPDKNVLIKHYYDVKTAYENVTVMKTHDTLYDAKVFCDAKYDCIGITNDYRTISNGVGSSQDIMYVKNRRGEQGCLDFHTCDTNAKYFGNSAQEGCCQHSGGLKGHGIPESLTRWLYKPSTCQNTFSINVASDNIIDGVYEFNTLEERTEAVNKVCELACTNGFPNIPDISPNVYLSNQPVTLINRIYSGCCSCAHNSVSRDSKFWNMRFSSQASPNVVDTRFEGSQFVVNNKLSWGASKINSKWWTPKSYAREDVAAKVNGPAMFANFNYRMEKYKENNYNECPMGKEMLCENDCALCESTRTGFNCASPCAVCLMGGYCDNTPSNDGSTKCECVSESLDPHGGCCPVGFSLITGSDILSRSSQIAGIKAGIITFYENNRGAEYNGAAAYFKSPITDLSIRDTAFAYSGDYKYLKDEQIQAGCYPCPGMFTSTAICDKDKCTPEDSELTLERMWTTTVALEQKESIWNLKLMPYEYQPQFFDFPFGYPEDNSYFYTEAFDYMVEELNGQSYDTVEEARRACNNDEQCKYISHIPPPPGDKPVWYDNVYVVANYEEVVAATSFENCWDAARFKTYALKRPTLVVYAQDCRAYWQVQSVVYSDTLNKMAYYTDKKFYLFSSDKETNERVGFVTYIKQRKYVDPIPYIPEFSDLYINGNRFSDSCGGDTDYCQAVQQSTYSDLNEEATSVFPNRLGCSFCDVRKIFSIYPSIVSVGDLYPIQNYHLGFAYSTGCAKCLPGQGGANGLQRLYEYCYPNGCESTDFVSNRYNFFSKWDVTGNISYPTNEQKMCGGELNSKCLRAGLALPMRDLSWKPSLGCSFCAAGSGFAYDLDNDGIIDDSQFNSEHSDPLYVNGDNICYENKTDCTVHHVSDDLTHAYGTVAVLNGILYETGKGQVDPYNFFSDWPKRVFCRKCPINTFSTDNTNCIKCPVGKTTIGEGATRCTACEPGKFYSLDETLKNESRCISCPPGMYQDEINKRSHRDLVPKGWRYLSAHQTSYNDLPDYAKGFGGCKVCPLGKFNPYEGQERCFGCPRGMSGKEGQWDTGRMVGLTLQESCQNCAVGTYQDEEGKPECKSCDDVGTVEQELFKPSETCVNNCQNGQWYEYPACVCECQPGYIGSNCDVFDPCANNHCNGGTCTVINNEAVCDCTTLDTFETCHVQDGACPLFEGKRYSGDTCNVVEYHPKCCVPEPSEAEKADSVINIWSDVLDDIASSYFWFGRPHTLKGGWVHVGNGTYVLQSTEPECSETHCTRTYPLATQEELFTDMDRNKHNSKADCYKTCPRGTYWIVPNNTLWVDSVTYANYSWWTQGLYAFLQSPDNTEYGSVLNNSAELKDITDLLPIETSCQPCHYTEYNDEPNQLQCKQCAGGYYSNLQIEPCKICNPGKYRNVSSPQICYECDQGQYQDISGQQKCKHCTELSFQDLTGQTSCKVCPSGKHVPNFSVTNSEAQCITCPAGQYQDEPGQMSQTQCKLCPKGKYQPNSESSSCLDCALGFYQDQEGQSSCVDCPQSKGTKHTSSKSLSDCGECSVEEDGKDPIDFDWCLGDTFSINGNPPPEVGPGVWSTCNGCCGNDWYQSRTCQYNHPKNQGYRGFNYLGCGNSGKIFERKCEDAFPCTFSTCSTGAVCADDSSIYRHDEYDTTSFVFYPFSGCDISEGIKITCEYTGC